MNNPDTPQPSPTPEVIMDRQDVLKPCPFPHDAKRGVFLEIDTEDFGFVRGACSDCGAAGPYVSLYSLEGATKDEKRRAVRLWNTRANLNDKSGEGDNGLS